MKFGVDIMESLKLSFEAILPIFLLMSLGYVLRALKIADKKGFDTVNTLVFKVFLPVLLFENIYKTESAQVFDVNLVAFIITGVLAVFVIGYFFVLLLSRDNTKRSVMLQSFFRSNYAILGIPIVNYICGDTAGGLASLMVALIVPLFNALAVVSFEIFRGGGFSGVSKTIIGVIKNPLIIGCAVGLAFFLSGIKLPPLIEKSVNDVAKIATPLSIIVLGAGFTFSSMKGYVKEILITVSVKLIVVPLVMITAAVLLGFRGEALACLLITFGAPVAVSSFSMSQQMGGDEKLSAQVIVISSIMCLLTLFGWIFALSSMKLF